MEPIADMHILKLVLIVAYIKNCNVIAAKSWAHNVIVN